MLAEFLAPPQSLAHLVDNLPSIVFIWHPDQGFEYINAAVETILGYQPAELQQPETSLRDLIHPADMAQVRQVINALQAAPEGLQSFTARCYHKKGSMVWLNCTLRQAVLEGHENPSILGVAHDVSEQQKSINTLKFHTTLLSSLKAPLFVTNLQGQITLWNEGARHLFGCDVDKIWGKSLQDLLHITSLSENIFLDNLTSLEHASEEFQLTRPDQSQFWVKLSGHVIKDENELPLGFLFNAGDITRQKLTKTRLARSHRELKAFYNFSLPLNETNDLIDWANAIVNQLTRDLNYQVVSLYLWEESQGYFQLLAMNWPGLTKAEIGSVLSLRRENRFALRQMPDGFMEGLPETLTRNYPPHFRRLQDQIKSVLFVPLKIEERIIGLLSVESTTPDCFTLDEERLLDTIARIIAIVVHNMQLLERERAERQISDTLREMSALLVSSLQLDKTLSIILESLERLLKFDSAALMLLTPTNRLRMVAARGMPRAEVTMASAQEIETFPLDEAVLSSKKPLAIADIRRDWRWTPLKGTEYICSWLGVPLLYRNRPLGLVTIDRAEVDPFSQEEIALAEAFAGHAAIALQNADLFSKVQTQQARLRKLSNRVVAAQEDERRRISRELHDEMGQALTAIKLNLQMLLAAPPPDETALIERLNELVALSNDSLQEVRRLAMDLRPTLLDDLGLVPTLNWYQTQFQKRCKTKLTLSVVPSLPRLSAETETALYRVAQEALTNISRHAEAHQAEISLSIDNEAIRFSIIDDGKGFITDADNRTDTSGVGLTSMLERIEALNGQLELSSSPGEGTCIFISIPNEVALKKS